MHRSFVVPAFNEELYLAECLQSILDEVGSQRTHDPALECEVIVVNNASTDRSRNVALRQPRRPRGR